MTRRGARALPRVGQRPAAWLAAAALSFVQGCATVDDVAPPRGMSVDEARSQVARLIPEAVADRRGWATDIHAAIAALDLAPTAEHACAAIAVIEQESGFRVDPPVPELPAIAAREIEVLRERVGVPKLVLDAALAMPSSTGRSYAERLASVRTEHELSQIYEDFVGRVPFGATLFRHRNPVRTGGPMQVSIVFAERHVAGRPYPYAMTGTVRDEVFSRRGGVYFGIAHLFDYPAPYDRNVYRFADFNAGHYASRNAAFQRAVTEATGVPLELDGDLLRYDAGRPARDAGATETAVRVLARRVGLDDGDVRKDLALEKEPGFERTRLYTHAFAAAEREAGRPLPRAMLPRIALKSPKITRKLTTAWFAERVNQRYERCLARSRAKPPSGRPDASGF